MLLADRHQVHRRAAELGLDAELTVTDARQIMPTTGVRSVQVMHRPQATSVEPGVPDVANVPYLLDCLREAIALVQGGQFHGLVTGPIDKAVINRGGVAFSGHTEFIAAALDVPLPVMLLVCDRLRVALVTTHIPLRQVADTITSGRLETTLRIVAADLRNRFGLPQPRLRVCGLNPHAGEAGYLGSEEQQVITPVLERLRGDGLTIEGPVPADTAFVPGSLDAVDVVVAMYHDQGLAVLKHIGFEDAVNVTLGLPIVRTSVDHGTAYGLAGTGTANPRSLAAAIRLAGQLAT